VLNPCWTPPAHVSFLRVLCCFWNDADLPVCRDGLVAVDGAETSHSALALPRIPWMFTSSMHRATLLQPPSTTFTLSTGNCREYFLPSQKAPQIWAKLESTLSQLPCAPLHYVGLESQCISSSKHLKRLASSFKPYESDTAWEPCPGRRGNHRITESQNSRGWKGPLWVI